MPEVGGEHEINPVTENLTREEVAAVVTRLRQRMNDSLAMINYYERGQRWGELPTKSLFRLGSVVLNEQDKDNYYRVRNRNLERVIGNIVAGKKHGLYDDFLILQEVGAARDDAMQDFWMEPGGTSRFYGTTEIFDEVPVYSTETRNFLGAAFKLQAAVRERNPLAAKIFDAKQKLEWRISVASNIFRK